jgi:hypothetical protein
MRTLVVCVLVVSLCVPSPLWAASNPLTTAPPSVCAPGPRAVVAPDVERVEILKDAEARAFVTALREHNLVFRQANAGDCMLRAALYESLGWCSTSAFTCAYFGPAWWNCMGTSCVTRIVALTVSEMRYWRENCQNGC